MIISCKGLIVEDMNISMHITLSELQDNYSYIFINLISSDIIQKCNFCLKLGIADIK